MTTWMPLLTEQSVEPVIVMCPEGGELRCYLDGTIAISEGSKMWQLRLPPGVALYHDTTRPVAVAERWSRDKLATELEGSTVVAANKLLRYHGFEWKEAIERRGSYGSLWFRGQEIIALVLDGFKIRVLDE